MNFCAKLQIVLPMENQLCIVFVLQWKAEKDRKFILVLYAAPCASRIKM